MGLWYSWLTHYTCNVESGVQSPVGPPKKVKKTFVNTEKVSYLCNVKKIVVVMYRVTS